MEKLLWDNQLNKWMTEAQDWASDSINSNELLSHNTLAKIQKFPPPQKMNNDANPNAVPAVKPKLGKKSLVQKLAVPSFCQKLFCSSAF